MSNNGLLHDISISDNIQGAQALPSIPREAILDTVPRSALAATKKIVNLVPITSGSVGPNQTIQFLIPQRNMAKASSVYLKFQLEFTTGAAQKASFSGALQSAAALFNNINIQAGGVVLESLQNYHLWHNNILSWAHQGNDELAIEALCSGSRIPLSAGSQTAGSGKTAVGDVISVSQFGMGFSAAGGNQGGDATALNVTAAGGPSAVNSAQFPAATALTVVFTIPILAGFFNPKEAQLIPLQFINGGVLVTLQTNPVSKAFYEPYAAGLITTYTISNMELCYAEISPAPEYILRVREEMMGGKMIKIECQSYQQYNVASGSSVRQNFNINLSSVSSLFWGRVIAPDSNITPKTFQGFGFDNDPSFRYEVYLDNVLLFQSPNQLNSIAVQVRQLQEALASTVSDYPISPFVCGRGNNNTYVAAGNYVASDGATYVNNMYTSAMLWGLSTKLFASNSTSMDGTPIGTLTINFTIGNSRGTGGVQEPNTNLWYIYAVYDYIYLVDATGSVSKNQ